MYFKLIQFFFSKCVSLNGTFSDKNGVISGGLASLEDAAKKWNLKSLATKKWNSKYLAKKDNLKQNKVK